MSGGVACIRYTESVLACFSIGISNEVKTMKQTGALETHMPIQMLNTALVDNRINCCLNRNN